jgi:isocitrate dehydrogenase
VGIKGPLTTPIGGGIRSLNVALRQMLDLYVCLRPVRWFKGVPSPVKRPQKCDMTIFRENCEDIYAGIEWEAGSRRREEGPRLHEGELPEGVREDSLPRVERHRHQARLPDGTERLVKAAIEHALR